MLLLWHLYDNSNNFKCSFVILYVNDTPRYSEIVDFLFAMNAWGHKTTISSKDYIPTCDLLHILFAASRLIEEKYFCQENMQGQLFDWSFSATSFVRQATVINKRILSRVHEHMFMNVFWISEKLYDQAIISWSLSVSLISSLRYFHVTFMFSRIPISARNFFAMEENFRLDV